MKTHFQLLRLHILGAVAACAFLFGVTEPSTAQGTIIQLTVFDFDFGTATHTHLDPTIHVGDTVEWLWDSSNVAEHSTTSASGQLESWNSGLHFAPFSFDHTFTQAGVFNYYCSLHGFDAGGGQVGGMSGHITVIPVPEPTICAFALVGLGTLLVLRNRRSS